MSKAGRLSFAGVLSAFIASAPSLLNAEARYSGNTALLAISFNDGRVAAGMMCNSVGSSSFDQMRDLPKSFRSIKPEGGMCRRSASSVLNPDVLAFDVTGWSRREIAHLVNWLDSTDDPLNHDFSTEKVAGRQIRRVDESRGEDGFEAPVFEFSFGCYLVVKVPAPSAVSGS